MDAQRRAVEEQGSRLSGDRLGNKEKRASRSRVTSRGRRRPIRNSSHWRRRAVRWRRSTVSWQQFPKSTCAAIMTPVLAPLMRSSAGPSGPRPHRSIDLTSALPRCTPRPDVPTRPGSSSRGSTPRSPAAKAPNNGFQRAAVLGEIALAENKPQEALKQFRAAMIGEDGAPTGCDACNAFNLGRTFDAAGQPDSAIAQYTAYLAVPIARRLNIDFRRPRPRREAARRVVRCQT